MRVKRERERDGEVVWDCVFVCGGEKVAVVEGGGGKG